jgi:hypothetical protein
MESSVRVLQIKKIKYDPILYVNKGVSTLNIQYFK